MCVPALPKECFGCCWTHTRSSFPGCSNPIRLSRRPPTARRPDQRRPCFRPFTRDLFTARDLSRPTTSRLRLLTALGQHSATAIAARLHKGFTARRRPTTCSLQVVRLILRIVRGDEPAVPRRGPAFRGPTISIATVPAPSLARAAGWRSELGRPPQNCRHLHRDRVPPPSTPPQARVPRPGRRCLANWGRHAEQVFDFSAGPCDSVEQRAGRLPGRRPEDGAASSYRSSAHASDNPARQP